MGQMWSGKDTIHIDSYSVWPREREAWGFTEQRQQGCPGIWNVPERLIWKEISNSLKLSMGCVSLRCMLHIQVIEKGIS